MMMGGDCPRSWVVGFWPLSFLCVLLAMGCGRSVDSSSAVASSDSTGQWSLDAAPPVAHYEGVLEIVSSSVDSVMNMKGSMVAAVAWDDPDLVLQFVAEDREDARIWIQAPETGEVHHQLYSGRVKPGLNAFRFQHDPLPSGVWEVVVAFQAGTDTIQSVLFNKSSEG